MKNLILNNIQGKKILLFLIITNLIYCVMIFYTIPQVMLFSQEMDLFDMMPLGYNYEYADSLLKALGENGINKYLQLQLPVDFIYPLNFGIAYCLLIAYLLSKRNLLQTKLFYLCYLPLLGGLFDYAENIAIINILKSYADLTQSAVCIASVMTIIKSVCTTISFTCILLLAGAVVVRWLKTRAQKAN